MEGTVPILVLHQRMVLDADKGVTVHHVIISTAVMSHWKMQVIKTDQTINLFFYGQIIFEKKFLKDFCPFIPLYIFKSLPLWPHPTSHNYDKANSNLHFLRISLPVSAFQAK